MSTHASIGVQQQDGSVKGVFVHWDGGLEYTGEKLKNFYSDEDIANELVSKGDMSFLGRTFDTCDFKGDQGSGIQVCDYRTVRDWMENEQQEYNYLFTDNEWNLVSRTKRIPLTFMKDVE